MNSRIYSLTRGWPRSIGGQRWSIFILDWSRKKSSYYISYLIWSYLIPSQPSFCCWVIIRALSSIHSRHIVDGASKDGTVHHYRSNCQDPCTWTRLIYSFPQCFSLEKLRVSFVERSRRQPVVCSVHNYPDGSNEHRRDPHRYKVYLT